MCILALADKYELKKSGIALWSHTFPAQTIYLRQAFKNKSIAKECPTMGLKHEF